ncbi:MAG: PDZ domain-containing protein [Planctomycetota bacterium]|nr:PDZ domain-containing protein [Planctomycetota bacterium]
MQAHCSSIRLSLAILVLSWGMCQANLCSGQSFLEKLEQAVKNQLEKEPQPAAAPANPTVTPPKPLVPPIMAVPPQPNTGKSQPSKAAPIPNKPQGSPTNSRPVFLGLEAEETVGGGIGVRVVEVTRNSPAAKAGFKVGDRIVAVNGYGIAKLDDMVQQIVKASPGQTVDFLLTRGGRSKKVSALLMDANLAEQSTGPSRELISSGPAYLGIKANDLTDSFRKQFGIGVFRGAAVARVTRGSPAANAGITAGDAIIEAGGVPIDSADKLKAWLSTVRPGQPVEVVFYRGTLANAVQIILGVGEGQDAGASSRRVIPPGTVRPANSPLELSPSVKRDVPTSSANAHLQALVEKLQIENDLLRKELRESNKTLADTQEKLDQIMQLLKKQ